MLRDVKDTTVGTLSQRITSQLMGLKGLNQKLQDMKSYLEKVATSLGHVVHYVGEWGDDHVCEDCYS